MDLAKNNYLLSFQQFGKKARTTTAFNKASNKVVRYTRVSSKEQADNNCSLENQQLAIDEFAARQNLEVIATFGGTYESAKTDGRLEFMRMLDFIKKFNTVKKKEEEKIVAIVVWHHSRFSRTGGKAIALADELREKYGVHILTVCNPLDTSNPHGIMMQDMQLVFSRWDNETRKENVVSGMKRKLAQGYWVSKPPRGYITIKSAGERKLVLDKEGKLISKAFSWKATGMQNVEIMERLASLGMKVSRQSLCYIFANPFYTGLMAHALLNGEVVEGNQEKAVGRELFLKVNEIVQNSPQYGIVHNKESEPTPMRGFLKCSCCGSPLTGYIVKKKWVNGKAKIRNMFPAYYKCNNKGCNVNIAAKRAHETFLQVLEYIRTPSELIPLLQFKMESQYEQSIKQQEEKTQYLKEELKEVEKNIDRMERKFYIKEEITKELFDKFNSEFKAEKGAIMKKIMDAEKSLSNPLKSVQQTLEVCSKLPEIWSCGQYEVKERLQRLVFPEGICFDKEKQAYRTPKLNSFVNWTLYHTKDSAKKKNANPPVLDELANSVVPTGIEPISSV